METSMKVVKCNNTEKKERKKQRVKSKSEK